MPPAVRSMISMLTGQREARPVVPFSLFLGFRVYGLGFGLRGLGFRFHAKDPE